MLPAKGAETQGGTQTSSIAKKGQTPPRNKAAPGGQKGKGPQWLEPGRATTYKESHINGKGRQVRVMSYRSEL